MLRSLVSAFPRGWPAVGLLLLRGLVGVTAVAQGAGAFREGISSISACGTAAFAIGAGAAVTVGFLTPIAAALLGAGVVGVGLGWAPWSGPLHFDRNVVTIFVVGMSAAIALLGPGAMSIDARLRGRREIIIPRRRENGGVE